MRIRDGGIEYVRYADATALLKIIRRLIDDGVAFIDQPAGWPPAAVVAQFHESGELGVPFRAISWRGPSDWFVRDVLPCAR